MTITTWRPRVTEARIKPEPRPWRHAAVIVPLVIGGLYAVVAVAGAARLPWEGVAAAVGLAAFAVVIAVASVTGNGVARRVRGGVRRGGMPGGSCTRS